MGKILFSDCIKKLIITIMLAMAISSVVYAEEIIPVYFNGQIMVFPDDDVKPQIINNRTYVPIRKVCEYLGLDILWYEDTKTFTFFKENVLLVQVDNNRKYNWVSVPDGGGIKISHKVGSNIILINGREVEFDTHSINKNSRTVMPIRMLAESIGCNVSWDNEKRSVFIKTMDYNEDFQDTTTEATTSSIVEDTTIIKSETLEIDKEEITFEEYTETTTYDKYQGYSDEEMAYEVYELTNKFRNENGLPSLVYNDSLCRAAQMHAEDMAKNNYFSHTSLDGREPGDRINQYTSEFDGSWGENIAKGQITPEEAVDCWINSPGHRANMLNGDYSCIGVGYYEGYWVQTFGGYMYDDYPHNVTIKIQESSENDIFENDESISEIIEENDDLTVEKSNEKSLETEDNNNEVNTNKNDI